MNKVLLILFFIYAGSAYSEEYAVWVNFREARLYLYELPGGNEIGNFPVALPKHKTKLPVTGEVSSVEKNPVWAPTRATREAYLKKNGKELPEMLRPGDPENAMGEGKIRIDFREPWAERTVRIHGTNDEKSIGTRVSRGCIRMKNKDVRELISVIARKKTSVFFVE